MLFLSQKQWAEGKADRLCQLWAVCIRGAEDGSGAVRLRYDAFEVRDSVAFRGWGFLQVLVAAVVAVVVAPRAFRCVGVYCPLHYSNMTNLCL